MITLDIKSGGRLIQAEAPGPIGTVAGVLDALGLGDVNNALAETAVEAKIRDTLDADGVAYTIDRTESKLIKVGIYVAIAFAAGYLLGGSK